MATAPSFTSELDAVNTIIGTIGLFPVNTLTGTLDADVAAAKSLLDEVSLAVQSEGWEFNCESDYVLTPDNNDEISTVGLLRVDINNKNVTQRGTRLYDKKNHSYTTFTDATYKAEVVVSLSWDELPQVARQYIAIRAARIFQARFVGSDTLDGFTEDDEFMARIALEQADLENADHSIFDHYDVARIVLREHQ